MYSDGGRIIIDRFHPVLPVGKTHQSRNSKYMAQISAKISPQFFSEAFTKLCAAIRIIHWPRSRNQSFLKFAAAAVLLFSAVSEWEFVQGQKLRTDQISLAA
jgi:hypothetical protein